MRNTHLAANLTLAFALVTFGAMAATPPRFNSSLVFPAYGATSMATGDFNGDGNLDLALASNQAGVGTTLSVFAGDGHGDLKARWSYQEPLPAQSNGSALAVADFNGDGKLDLAQAVEGTAGGVMIWLGNGDGTFQPPISNAGGVSPYTLAVADFNGDGKPDLVVTNGYPARNLISVLLNNGDGTFQPPVTLTVPDFPDCVAAADLNGDGRIDLVVATETVVAVLLGNGDGTFQGPVSYDSGITNALGAVVADFNRDGVPDLAMISPYNLAVMLGNGDGSFQPATLSDAGDAPISLATGDFNGDGTPDLAVGYSGVSVLLGQGDGSFSPPVSYVSGDYTERLAAGDFNNDHRLDLVAINVQSDTISLLLGDGKGRFPSPPMYGEVFEGDHFAMADFNGDGKPDLVVTSAYYDQSTYDIGIYLGNGDGTLKPPILYNYPSNVMSVAAADFNMDGKPDLALKLQGKVAITLGNGDGTFQRPTVFAAGGDFIFTADFNGDGKSDLAMLSVEGVTICLGNGDGTFGAPAHYLAGGILTTWPQAISMATATSTWRSPTCKPGTFPSYWVTAQAHFDLALVIRPGANRTRWRPRILTAMASST